jgi:hypothetical protein
MEGVFIGSGPGFRPGAVLSDGADLLDIAPTLLQMLGVPVPSDMDGHVLTDILDPALRGPSSPSPDEPAGLPTEPVAVAYTEEEDAAIQQRLADLGYL